VGGILVDKISSLYKIKEMIRKSLNDKDIDFINIRLEERPSFIPQIKLDLVGLREIINQFSAKSSLDAKI
jgi:hypothetical protein